MHEYIPSDTTSIFNAYLKHSIRYNKYIKCIFKTFHQIQQVHMGPGPAGDLGPPVDPGPEVDPGPVVDPGPAGTRARRHNQQETQGTLAQHRRFLGINSDCTQLFKISNI